MSAVGGVLVNVPAPLLACEHGAAGWVVTDASNAALRLLGARRDGVVGHPVEDVVAGLEIPADLTPVLRVVVIGGARRWLRFSFGRDGERVLVGCEDRGADAEQGAYQRLFGSVPVPTFVWQHHVRDGADDYALVDFNDAANALSHGRLEILRGNWLSTDIAHHPTVFGDMAECMRSGQLVHREIEHTMNTTGELKRLSVTYCPVPPDLVLSHTEDVTQRVQLEAELLHAQKLEAVGRLAAGIAHDFNNLLTVIEASSTLVLDEIGASPVREDVVAISDAVRRATALTRQLLTFSRRQVVRPRVVDLSAVVTDVEPMLRRLLGRDIRFEIELAPEAAQVLADPGQLEQVIMNLAINARDAMDRGGKLALRTATSLTGVMLTVGDTGHGIDAATRTRIFEPFFTTKDPGRGTGLGLSTVLGIVEQAGGTVAVDSAVGAGTTFSITFPRAAGPDLVVAPVVPARPRHGGTILLADDETKVRVLVRRLLESEGYRVLEAIHGRDALDVATRHAATIDLLLTDVVMPEVDGRELYETLRARHPGLRVLFMSAYANDVMLRRAVPLSGADFLSKPFTPPQLASAVATILSATRPGSAPASGG